MDNIKSLPTVSLLIMKALPSEKIERWFLENWRPISVVNVDTKIMTKAIVSRIKNVLPDVIHPNQTGYDRFRGETRRSHPFE